MTDYKSLSFYKLYLVFCKQASKLFTSKYQSFDWCQADRELEKIKEAFLLNNYGDSNDFAKHMRDVDDSMDYFWEGYTPTKYI